MVPEYIPGKENKELYKKLRDVGIDTPNDVLSSLLEFVSINIYNRYPKEFNESLITVLNLVRSLGFYVRADTTPFVVEKLIAAGIVIKTIQYVGKKNPESKGRIYYFTHKSRIPEAKKVLINDTDMKKYLENPVFQITGEKIEQIPNTTELESERYRSLRSLLGRLNIYPGKNGFDVQRMFEDCPVEIFQARAGRSGAHFYRYPANSEEKLIEFISSKLNTASTPNS